MNNANENPNVLFIICDDLNNAIDGMGRSPHAPTPNLRRLMKEGVRFPNAFNNCPLCLPSRNSLFSGLLPHRTGHYTLWDQWRTVTPHATTRSRDLDHWGVPLLGNSVMMPRHFKQNGYNVYGAGKVLHEGVVDPEWWTEYAYGPDYGPWLGGAMTKREQWLCEGDPLEAYLRRFFGIDRHFVHWQRFRLETGFGSLPDVFGGREAWNRDGAPYRYLNDENRDPLPDEKTVAWGVDILRRQHDQPFMLALGFMKPHTPLNAPQAYFDMFPPERLELPPMLAGDVDDCARALVEHRPYGFLMYDIVTKGGEALWREWLQAYLACVAFIDDQIGKVLDALAESPFRDDTVVIVTSDNGYHMGEKEYLYKDSLWEESSQIPLIVKAPGLTGGDAVCQTPVSLIDVYPTLVDLCGLPTEPHADTHGFPLDGHSLRPLLEKPAEGVWNGSPVALTSVRGDTGVHHSVRSSTHRYTLCGNGEEELYDHRVDPHEWRNLANDVKHDQEKKQLRAELTRLLWGNLDMP